MRRTRAQEIKRLQKKLIPVNLLVCILCIVASLSLFFMPIVKINLATIVGNATLKQLVTDIAVEKVNAFIEQAGDSIDGSLGGGTENGGTNDGSQDGSEGGSEDGSENENPEGGEENGGVSAQSEENGEETGGSEEGDNGNGDGNKEPSNPDEGDGEGSEGSEGSENVTIKDLIKEIDVNDLVSTLVDEIFSEIKADISVSSRNSLTVFMAQNKAETLLDELFFNEAKGFVSNLKNTLISGFGNAFKAAGDLVQSAVVKAIVVPALKESLPKEYADLVVAEELQAAIDSLDNAKSAQEASDTIVNYINGLSEGSTEVDKLTPEQEADISRQITELYDKTVAETGEGNFTVEAMISVMASEMLGGVGDFSLTDIIAGFVNSGSGGNGDGGNEEPSNPDEGEPEAQIVKLFMLSKIARTEGEPADGNGEYVGEGGLENGSEDGGDGEEGGVTKYTSYRAMGEGIARDFIGEDFESTLKTMIMNSVGENDAVFGYYGYIFIGLGFFILMWLILFLFAFFHMFARNKRFMMWYVKMFCAWPCIIFWLIPMLIKNVLSAAFPDLYAQVMQVIVNFFESSLNTTVTAAQATELFNTLLSSVQTFAWISGICYLLLWAISIFWAFPIKHKIRKLKRSR